MKPNHDSIERRVKDAFVGGQPPEAIAECARRRVRAQVRRPSRWRFVTRVAVPVAVAAVLVGAAFALWPRTPPDEVIAEKALAAMSEPGTVVHLEMAARPAESDPDSYRYGGPDYGASSVESRRKSALKEPNYFADNAQLRADNHADVWTPIPPAVDAVPSDAWIHPSDGSVRVQVAYSGPLREIGAGSSQRHRHPVDVNPDHGLLRADSRALGRSASRDSAWTSLIRTYAEAMRSGRFEVFGAQTLNGVETVRVRLVGTRKPIVANLRTSDYLPIRLGIESPSTGRLTSVLSVRPEVVEASEVPSSAIQVRPPRARTHPKGFK